MLLRHRPSVWREEFSLRALSLSLSLSRFMCPWRGMYIKMCAVQAARQSMPKVVTHRKGVLHLPNFVILSIGTFSSNFSTPKPKMCVVLVGFILFQLPAARVRITFPNFRYIPSWILKIIPTIIGIFGAVLMIFYSCSLQPLTLKPKWWFPKIRDPTYRPQYYNPHYGDPPKKYP